MSVLEKANFLNLLWPSSHPWDDHTLYVASNVVHHWYELESVSDFQGDSTRLKSYSRILFEPSDCGEFTGGDEGPIIDSLINHILRSNWLFFLLFAENS